MTGDAGREGCDVWASTLRGGPPVLVTGAAGFIGYHVAVRLLDAGVPVVGFDVFSPYYDVTLKRTRAAALARRPGFEMIEGDLADPTALGAAFTRAAPRHVVHLAAQAGVRHSIDNPFAYARSNLDGFLAVLEACRSAQVAHLIYASSSSVYGGNARTPFSTSDSVDHPVSLYAATKKANELMAHAYCHLYGFPATGLRFFTVYGPWGRPDMAYWKFTEAIAAGEPIDVFNHGDMARDFTYIDDVVESLLRLIPRPAAADPAYDRTAPDPATSWAPHRVYNIGATRPERLLDMIAMIETHLGRRADMRMQPMQPGDVKETWADVADLEAAVGFRPRVDLRTGLGRFTTWWRDWTSGAIHATASR